MNDKTLGPSFMDKYGLLVVAAVLALAVSALAFNRVNERQRAFNRTVRVSLDERGSYDQQLIDMVNELEAELAARASFGYTGRKDPLTGTTRVVAALPNAPRTAAVARPSEARGAAPVRASGAVDPVRLTAIIFDNARNSFTAIVMDGERSLSVSTGDRVAGRRVTRISNTEIQMESDQERFVYNILGGNTRTPKN